MNREIIEFDNFPLLFSNDNILSIIEQLEDKGQSFYNNVGAHLETITLLKYIFKENPLYIRENQQVKDYTKRLINIVENDQWFHCYETDILSLSDCYERLIAHYVSNLLRMFINYDIEKQQPWSLQELHLLKKLNTKKVFQKQQVKENQITWEEFVNIFEQAVFKFLPIDEVLYDQQEMDLIKYGNNVKNAARLVCRIVLTEDSQLFRYVYETDYFYGANEAIYSLFPVFAVRKQNLYSLEQAANLLVTLLSEILINYINGLDLYRKIIELDIEFENRNCFEKTVHGWIGVLLSSNNMKITLDNRYNDLLDHCKKYIVEANTTMHKDVIDGDIRQSYFVDEMKWGNVFEHNSRNTAPLTFFVENN
jgi:hypothetical protein